MVTKRRALWRLYQPEWGDFQYQIHFKTVSFIFTILNTLSNASAERWCLQRHVYIYIWYRLTQNSFISHAKYYWFHSELLYPACEIVLFRSELLYLACEIVLFRSELLYLTCEIILFRSEMLYLACEIVLFLAEFLYLTCEMVLFRSELLYLTCEIVIFREDYKNLACEIVIFLEDYKNLALVFVNFPENWQIPHLRFWFFKLFSCFFDITSI